jgi:soluble lytic murein transglycosylase-like protein
MMFIGGMAVLTVVGIINRPVVPLAAQRDSGIDIAWLPETVQRWEDDIIEMGHRYDIEPKLLAIVMTLESGGYTQAVSPADARGLMQVIPPTGQDIAERYLKEPRDDYDLMDPRTSIEFGAAYLAMLRDEFGEPDQAPSWDRTVELVAAGYNGGPGAAGNLYRGEGLASVETESYSRDALSMWRERDASESPAYDRWFERGGSRLIDLAKEEQAD